MATDATGTPTSLGIRKYNTSADAPSGLGFNGAMDDIDALLAARVAKSLWTTTGDLLYASGVSTPTRLGIGSTGQVLTVAGGLPSWGTVTPVDLGYVEFTAPVTVSSTTQATPTDIVSAGALTFDGGAYWFEFFAPFVTPFAGANAAVFGSFYDGTTEQGKTLLAQDPSTQSLSVAAYVRRKMSPSAGSHTFKFSCWQAGGNGTITAGAGGSNLGNYFPGFIRITKA